MANRRIRTSKFLSYVLRHNPDAIGLTLHPGGWVDLNELIDAARRNGRDLSRSLVERVIAESDKERFAISADGQKIRANYGHSVEVNLDVTPAEPPEHLFHGTARRTLPSIKEKGLTPQSRQYVHLSTDRSSAVAVGQRHGKPVVLTIRARAMHDTGHVFFEATGSVWLTAEVPPRFIVFPK